MLTGMLDRFGSWDSTRDSKMNALVDLLRNDHPGEKVLVFTEYVDTAEYVAQALQEAGVERLPSFRETPTTPVMLPADSRRIPTGSPGRRSS